MDEYIDIEQYRDYPDDFDRSHNYSADFSQFEPSLTQQMRLYAENIAKDSLDIAGDNDPRITDHVRTDYTDYYDIYNQSVNTSRAPDGAVNNNTNEAMLEVTLRQPVAPESGDRPPAFANTLQRVLHNVAAYVDEHAATATIDSLQGTLDTHIDFHLSQLPPLPVVAPPADFSRTTSNHSPSHSNDAGAESIVHTHPSPAHATSLLPHEDPAPWQPVGGAFDDSYAFDHFDSSAHEYDQLHNQSYTGCPSSPPATATTSEAPGLSPRNPSPQASVHSPVPSPVRREEHAPAAPVPAVHTSPVVSSPAATPPSHHAYTSTPTPTHTPPLTATHSPTSALTPVSARATVTDAASSSATTSTKTSPAHSVPSTPPAPPSPCPRSDTASTPSAESSSSSASLPTTPPSSSPQPALPPPLREEYRLPCEPSPAAQHARAEQMRADLSVARQELQRLVAQLERSHAAAHGEVEVRVLSGVVRAWRERVAQLGELLAAEQKTAATKGAGIGTVANTGRAQAAPSEARPMSSSTSRPTTARVDARLALRHAQLTDPRHELSHCRCTHARDTAGVCGPYCRKFQQGSDARRAELRQERNARKAEAEQAFEEWRRAATARVSGMLQPPPQLDNDAKAARVRGREKREHADCSEAVRAWQRKARVRQQEKEKQLQERLAQEQREKEEKRKLSQRAYREWLGKKAVVNAPAHTPRSSPPTHDGAVSPALTTTPAAATSVASVDVRGVDASLAPKDELRHIVGALATRGQPVGSRAEERALFRGNNFSTTAAGRNTKFAEEFRATLGALALAQNTALPLTESTHERARALERAMAVEGADRHSAPRAGKTAAAAISTTSSSNSLIARAPNRRTRARPAAAQGSHRCAAASPAAASRALQLYVAAVRHMRARSVLLAHVRDSTGALLVTYRLQHLLRHVLAQPQWWKQIVCTTTPASAPVRLSALQRTYRLLRHTWPDKLIIPPADASEAAARPPTATPNKVNKEAPTQRGSNICVPPRALVEPVGTETEASLPGSSGGLAVTPTELLMLCNLLADMQGKRVEQQAQRRARTELVRAREQAQRERERQQQLEQRRHVLASRRQAREQSLQRRQQASPNKVERSLHSPTHTMSGSQRVPARQPARASVLPPRGSTSSHPQPRVCSTPARHPRPATTPAPAPAPVEPSSLHAPACPLDMTLHDPPPAEDADHHWGSPQPQALSPLCAHEAGKYSRYINPSTSHRTITTPTRTDHAHVALHQSFDISDEFSGSAMAPPTVAQLSAPASPASAATFVPCTHPLPPPLAGNPYASSPPASPTLSARSAHRSSRHPAPPSPPTSSAATLSLQRVDALLAKFDAQIADDAQRTQRYRLRMQRARAVNATDSSDEPAADPPTRSSHMQAGATVTDAAEMSAGSSTSPCCSPRTAHTTHTRHQQHQPSPQEEDLYQYATDPRALQSRITHHAHVLYDAHRRTYATRNATELDHGARGAGSVAHGLQRCTRTYHADVDPRASYAPVPATPTSSRYRPSAPPLHRAEVATTRSSQAGTTAPLPGAPATHSHTYRLAYQRARESLAAEADERYARQIAATRNDAAPHVYPDIYNHGAIGVDGPSAGDHSVPPQDAPHHPHPHPHQHTQYSLDRVPSPTHRTHEVLRARDIAHRACGNPYLDGAHPGQHCYYELPEQPIATPRALPAAADQRNPYYEDHQGRYDEYNAYRSRYHPDDYVSAEMKAVINSGVGHNVYLHVPTAYASSSPAPRPHASAASSVLSAYDDGDADSVCMSRYGHREHHLLQDNSPRATCHVGAAWDDGSVPQCYAQAEGPHRYSAAARTEDDVQWCDRTHDYTRWAVRAGDAVHGAGADYEAWPHARHSGGSAAPTY